MTFAKQALICAFAVALCISPAAAHEAPSPAGTIMTRFNQALPTVPGKTMTAVEVTLAPGQASVPHRHAKSAFIMAYVVSGVILNQIEGEPAKVYRAGDTWMEAPGAHHIKATNLSKTRSAKLLAVFVADSDDTGLTTLDKP